MKKLVPALPEALIETCGPLSCRFFKLNHVRDYCGHNGKSFSRQDQDKHIGPFPEWCPLETVDDPPAA